MPNFIGMQIEYFVWEIFKEKFNKLGKHGFRINLRLEIGRKLKKLS